MQSVSTTIYKIGFAVLCSCLITTTSFSQENSPFSRFGLGNLSNSQHIVNRAMGGLSVAYLDGQTVNFSNPATFANARIFTYDLGITIDSRTLRDNRITNQYNSTNFSPSYLAISAPLNAKKRLGISFGFKPVTRINYSVARGERINNIDSAQTLFEGTGGLNQFYVGVGKRWNGLSLGVTTGYNFGKKEASTKRAFINDTVAYYKSNYATTTSFSGAFLNVGVQYEKQIDTGFNKKTLMTERFFIRLGATANLGQRLFAKQDFNKETFEFDNNGGIFKIDSITSGTNLKGRIKIPTTYTAGFTLLKTTSDATATYDVWSIGAEITTAKWSEYSFYNQKDATVDMWQFKVGAQWVPNAKNLRSYFSRINYRAGFNVGKDYINADGKELKTYGFTFGFGLPVRPARFSYQYSTIHTAIEFGRRGSAVNTINESYLQLSVGLSLSDLWFIKRKYD